MPRGDFDGGAVIILTKKGNHGAASIAGARVINYRFEAVADFDSIFAIVWSKQQQRSGVVFFRADAEMFEEIDGIVFDRAIIERTDGDDCELRAGFLLQLGAERFQAFASGGRNHPGKIADVTGRRNCVDVVGERRATRTKRQYEQKDDSEAAGRCGGRKQKSSSNSSKKCEERPKQASRFSRKSASGVQRGEPKKKDYRRDGGEAPQSTQRERAKGMLRKRKDKAKKGKKEREMSGRSE